jgi:predicted NBD/HSP70 family sugar kinase
MANKNILNFNNIKQTNQFLVLNMLLEHGPMSRVDISRELKCDGTTITHIIRNLMQQNLIKSLGMAKPSGGRPKELIVLNSESKQAIGISFEFPYITGIITGLTGEIEFSEKIYAPQNISSEKLLSTVKKLTLKLISITKPQKLLGIGIATCGVFFPTENRVINSNYFPAIRNLNFTDMFQAEFNISPEIIASSHAKALAEIRFSTIFKKNEIPNFILVNIDIGISLLNVCDSIPMIGKNSYLGEFGHIVIDPEGEKCYCGHQGCLESFCSIPAIKKKIAKALARKNVSFDEIISLYRQGNDKVVKLINSSAEVLGTAVGNVMTIFPSNKIIFTGRMMKLGNRYFEVLKKNIYQTTFPLFIKKSEILCSQDLENDAARGACAVILKSFFDGSNA